MKKKATKKKGARKVVKKAKRTQRPRNPFKMLEVGGTFDTKAEAVAAAKRFMREHPERSYIEVFYVAEDGRKSRMFVKKNPRKKKAAAKKKAAPKRPVNPDAKTPTLTEAIERKLRGGAKKITVRPAGRIKGKVYAWVSGSTK